MYSHLKTEDNSGKLAVEEKSLKCSVVSTLACVYSLLRSANQCNELCMLVLNAPL